MIIERMTDLRIHIARYKMDKTARIESFIYNSWYAN